MTKIKFEKIKFKKNQPKNVRLRVLRNLMAVLTIAGALGIVAMAAGALADDFGKRFTGENPPALAERPSAPTVAAAQTPAPAPGQDVQNIEPAAGGPSDAQVPPQLLEQSGEATQDSTGAGAAKRLPQ